MDTRPMNNDPHPAESIIDGLIDHARAMAKSVQPGDGEYHLRSLLRVYDWAKGQLPFRVGDKVKLRETIDLTNSPGWQSYANLLVRGGTGTVEDIDFNGVYEYWQLGVRFDADPSAGRFALQPERFVSNKGFRGCPCPDHHGDVCPDWVS